MQIIDHIVAHDVLNRSIPVSRGVRLLGDLRKSDVMSATPRHGLANWAAIFRLRVLTNHYVADWTCEWRPAVRGRYHLGPVGELPEWPMGTDCKSVGDSLRRFESFTPHQNAGAAPVDGKVGRDTLRAGLSRPGKTKTRVRPL